MSRYSFDNFANLLRPFEISLQRSGWDNSRVMSQGRISINFTCAGCSTQPNETHRSLPLPFRLSTALCCIFIKKISTRICIFKYIMHGYLEFISSLLSQFLKAFDLIKEYLHIYLYFISILSILPTYIQSEMANCLFQSITYLDFCSLKAENF